MNASIFSVSSAEFIVCMRISRYVLIFVLLSVSSFSFYLSHNSNFSCVKAQVQLLVLMPLFLLFHHLIIFSCSISIYFEYSPSTLNKIFFIVHSHLISCPLRTFIIVVVHIFINSFLHIFRVEHLEKSHSSFICQSRTPD